MKTYIIDKNSWHWRFATYWGDASDRDPPTDMCTYRGQFLKGVGMITLAGLAILFVLSACIMGLGIGGWITYNVGYWIYLCISEGSLLWSSIPEEVKKTLIGSALMVSIFTVLGTLSWIFENLPWTKQFRAYRQRKRTERSLRMVKEVVAEEVLPETPKEPNIWMVMIRTYKDKYCTKVTVE